MWSGICVITVSYTHLDVYKRQENAHLKRQLAEQEEELLILQKAATYFAKRLK